MIYPPGRVLALAQASRARRADPDSLPWVFEGLTDKDPGALKQETGGLLRAP